MNIGKIAAFLAFAAVLPAQSFIQMSDPQFGMYSKDQNFTHETVNFEFAIATANRLKPAFVVVTGDLVNKAGDAAQIAEFKRISGKIDPKIRLFSVPGNHDEGNEPTAESLARYRERFGANYYTFQVGGITGIVLDSNLEKNEQKLPEEAAKMEAWLRAELTKAKQEPGKRVIVFQHHPLFLKDPNEADQYFNIPRETRLRYVKLLHEFGVREVFAGHLHHNEEARDGELAMVGTGPVGMPLDGAKSGMRIVTLASGKLTHKYYDFGELPEAIP